MGDTMILRLILALILSGDIIYSQEPVAGPITDAIEAKFRERFDKQEAEMKAIEGRLQLAFGDRLKELASQVQEARDERKTIIESFRSWNQERVGLLARIQDFSEKLTEAQVGFAPIKWLIDRATMIVWALIVFVVSILVLFLIVIAVVARLYLWMSRIVVPKV